MAAFRVSCSYMWLLLCSGGFLRAVDSPPARHPSVIMGGNADSREHDVVELWKGSLRIAWFDGELHTDPQYETRLGFNRTHRFFSLACPTVEDSGRYKYNTSSNSSAAGDELFSMIHVLLVIDPGMENQSVLLGEPVRFNESSMFANLLMSIDGINFSKIVTYHGGLYPSTQQNFNVTFNVTFNVGAGSFVLSKLTPADSAFYRTEIHKDVDSKLLLISSITEHLQVVPASDGSCTPGDNETLHGKGGGQRNYRMGLVIFAAIIAIAVFTALVYGLSRNRLVLHIVAKFQENILGIYRVVGSTEQHLNGGTEMEMNALNGELETVTESPGSLHEPISLLDSGPGTDDAVAV